MKLFFLAPSIKTGGGNRVFIELANKLCGKYKVYIVYPNNSLESNSFHKDRRVNFCKIGSYSTSKIIKLWNLLRCILYINRESGNSKIIISDPIFCLFILFIKNKKNVFRFIQSDDYSIYDDGKILGNGLVLRIYKYLCLKGYSHKISYIFNSHFVYDSYCSNSKRKDIPCVLVYPAINHNIFKIYENNRDNIKKTICLVARKHPLKGLRTFINMYKNLPDKYRMKIASIKLITHDELMGFDITGMDVVRPTCDEDIADVYQNSDIFISTSWQEGFGLPPLEAMACGCAVITSKSGGVNEFAKENENCLMFEPKNELELSEQLIKLLEDENLRKRIAYEGIKTAQKFDWNKSAQQLINVL